MQLVGRPTSKGLRTKKSENEKVMPVPKVVHCDFVESPSVIDETQNLPALDEIIDKEPLANRTKRKTTKVS